MLLNLLAHLCLLLLGQDEQLFVFFVLENACLVAIELVLNLDTQSDHSVSNLSVQVENFGDVHCFVLFREVRLGRDELRIFDQSLHLIFEEGDSLRLSSSEGKSVLVEKIERHLGSFESQSENCVEEALSFPELIDRQRVFSKEYRRKRVQDVFFLFVGEHLFQVANLVERV